MAKFDYADLVQVSPAALTENPIFASLLALKAPLTGSIARTFVLRTGTYYEIALEPESLLRLPDAYLIAATVARHDLSFLEVAEAHLQKIEEWGEESDALLIDSIKVVILRLEALQPAIEAATEAEMTQQTEEEREATIEAAIDLGAAWLEQFKQHPLYQDLPAPARAQAESILPGFFEDAIVNYQQGPGAWRPNAVEGFFQEPATERHKPVQLRPHPGKIMHAFFAFLEQVGLMEDTERLRLEIEDIMKANPVPPSNLTSKELTDLMGQDAQRRGIDLKEPDGLSSYLHEATQTPNPFQGLNIPTDPFRHLQRNDRITVRYPDGTLKERVRFKEVAQDLRAGRCEWVE